MKKSFLLVTLAFALGIGLTALILINPLHLAFVETLRDGLGMHSQNSIEMGSDSSPTGLWTCGMHPEVISDEPGTCPICQMELTPVKGSVPATTASTDSGERRIKYWKAPMDPTYIRNEPGKSPMGMDLVPVYEDEISDLPGVVKVDPGFIQMIGVDTLTVQRTDIPFTVRAVGSLTYNDRQTAVITTKYEGWIEKVYVNYVGEPVKKGERLFEIYSPQLVTTQKDYLQAIDYAERLSQGDYPDIERRARSLLESARQRLEFWDISPAQIRELEKSRNPRRTLTVTSEVSGLVMEKMGQALEGMYVKPGMNLYKLVDLSTVWVDVEVFENQVPWLEVGQRAEIEIPYQPGKTYSGRIRYVFPYLNEKTRTLKLSIELPNPDRQLRAGMYADVTFKVPAARDVLAVPAEAVIQTGTRNIVVVELEKGTFQVRDVETGVKGEQLWEIRSGLSEGDRVVLSSQFLIDSESNLQEAIRQVTSRRRNNSGTEKTSEVPDHRR